MKQKESTILVKYNGKPKEINTPSTVGSLLARERVDGYPKSVLLNGVYLSREKYEDTYLKKCDNIRVIVFMGGG